MSDTLDRWGCRALAADASGEVAHSDVDWTSEPMALVVGSEAHGLSAEVRENAAVRFCRIPLASGLESLNAAVAGSIILFEAQRQQLAAGAARRES